MKFIVDAQLPRSLSNLLCSKGYESIHTLELPDRNKTSDSFISDLAVKESRVVITKDADFLDSFLIKSIPPKLVIVKTGNINNTALLIIFGNYIDYIADSLIDNSLIEVTKTEIIIHR